MNRSLPIKGINYGTQAMIGFIKNKDVDGFGLFYDQYSPPLYTWILNKTNDIKTAEEILLNSFLKIWKTIHLYDSSKCKLFIWMLQVTAKEIKRYLEPLQYGETEPGTQKMPCEK